MRPHLKSGAVGAIVAIAVVGGSAALAGSGIGGVFNLGQSNSVNGQSALSGTTAGNQLRVQNSSTAATGVGIYGQSGSATGAGIEGVNNAGGPGLQSVVSGNTVAPLKVNSNHVVANLHAANSDQLGGHGSTYFLPTSGTAANSNQLGGRLSDAYFRLRGAPQANGIASLSANASWHSATVGADGLPVIAFLDGSNSHVVLAHCLVLDCSSKTETSLAAGNVSGNISIAIDAEGFALFTYQDLNGHLAAGHCTNVACTQGAFGTIDNSPNVGINSSVAIGTDGLGVIAYRDSGNGALKVAHCTTQNCATAFSPVTVDTGGVGLQPSITIGSDGFPLISYQDDTHQVMRVVHCTSTDCSTTDTPHNLDAAIGSGLYSSITVGSDGMGLISYAVQGVVDHLRVGHCTDVACNTVTITELDVPNHPNVTALTIGPDGLGIVAYATTANHLRVVHCTDVGCSSAYATDLVTSNAARPSITIGSDGLPLITYSAPGVSDQTSVAHCANAFCVSYFRRR